MIPRLKLHSCPLPPCFLLRPSAGVMVAEYCAGMHIRQLLLVQTWYANYGWMIVSKIGTAKPPTLHSIGVIWCAVGGAGQW